MQILKQSTVEVIQFGPFVDKDDGVTLKTDATTITDIDHASTGIFVSKNGAAAAVRNQAIAAASVADAYGKMRVTLDATDTDELGTLDVTFAKAATYLPVEKEFMVIPATLYDTLFATQPAAAIKKFFDVATPTGTVDSLPDAVAGAASGLAIVGSEMVVPDTQKVDVETIKTKAVTAGAAITINASVGAATIVPTNTQFEARSLLAAAYTIVSDLGVVQSADNDTLLTAIAGYLDTEIAAIKDVTDALPDAGALTTIGADTARLTAARAGALTDWIDGGRLDLLLDAIKVITDALTAAAATKLALSAGTIVGGTVSWDKTNATTTVIYCDDITEATADHFNGRQIIFTDGALQYQASSISDYELDSGEGKFTVVALTEPPADNVKFIIV